MFRYSRFLILIAFAGTLASSSFLLGQCQKDCKTVLSWKFSSSGKIVNRLYLLDNENVKVKSCFSDPTSGFIIFVPTPETGDCVDFVNKFGENVKVRLITCPDLCTDNCKKSQIPQETTCPDDLDVTKCDIFDTKNMKVCVKY